MHVKDFGAVSDGIHDDSRAIQNAINAALGALPAIDGASGPVRVYFPPGTYHLTGELFIGGTDMAGELPFYTEINGTWHTIGEGEVTLCGLRLPYPDAKWQRDVPDNLHCGADDPLVKLAQGEEPDVIPEGKTVAEAAAMEAVAPPETKVAATKKTATRKSTKSTAKAKK